MLKFAKQDENSIYNFVDTSRKYCKQREDWETSLTDKLKEMSDSMWETLKELDYSDNQVVLAPELKREDEEQNEDLDMDIRNISEKSEEENPEYILK